MYNIHSLLASGTALITLLNPFVPVAPQQAAQLSTAAVAPGEVETPTVQLIDAFFGTDASYSEAEAIIDRQMKFVSSRSAYSASLDVVEKHAEAIKQEAKKQGVPEDVAIGVAFLENGGSETAKSPAGALGIYQLMPRTAQNLGLTVNKTVDERKSPSKSIQAGITYLAKNFQRFGDWGLATWAYHAGEGNVAKALKAYAKANDGITLPGVDNFDALRSYVEENKITIHKLLSDPSVKKITDKLNDDTAGYPYKVVATATLFKQAN